jgi:hypothetical protein
MEIDWRKKYDNSGIFHEGRAWVKLNGKRGFVDEHGNEVIPLKYDGVGSYHNGKALIQISDCWGQIDLDGKEYFTPQARAKLRQLKIQQLLKDL